MTYGTLIQTVTAGAGGTASLDFNSIPQTYSDLLVVVSGRFNNGAAGDFKITFNSNTTGYSRRHLYGNGSTAASASGADGYAGRANPASFTTNTFSNGSIYIPNYTGSANKIWASDSVDENNATNAFSLILAGLWSNTAAITSISLSDLGASSNWVQGSTASLYGISNTIAAGPKASGGNYIVTTGGYTYHVFLTSGSFVASQNITADVLVIAGGGGGGVSYGAGGGAGGLAAYSSQSLTSGTYTVTVGAGGAAGNPASNGSNSVFGALTAAVGGGRGGSSGGMTAGNGGSGGGAGASGAGFGVAGTATAGQGNNGGNANGGSYPNYGIGGGGGAGGVGGNASAGGVGGNAGPGSSAYTTWGSATGTGTLSSGTYYYAGGGAGNGYSGAGAAGSQGGVAQGAAGPANTGSGGGGDGANGGSGIVIVRYA